ncbi:hypothetical protein H8S90_22240 [Olivibacter sp. SDN3]|uniref:hypothetical protein n=1 Tax=Olivibacter sp. SDN3 TaxID=2764720 RepID=UPI0016511DAA|nr:hypothetical protein [Olivibacter sp. SDN3]QNL49416.1 hypothetical protein H8S90_22240 [Olivibacter sp. SDN3]
MLFKQRILEGIKSGNISLAFRKWKKASIKKETVIKTAIGLVAIVDVEEINPGSISPEDAIQAGFEQVATLLKSLGNGTGKLYKISVKYAGTDPRIRMREKEQLSDEELELLKSKVDRLDSYSKSGYWTTEILQAIKKNPKLRAVDLALKTGRSKEWIKINIRKLKNLGLTISHETGYTLSPLGDFFLNQQR